MTKLEERACQAAFKELPGTSTGEYYWEELYPEEKEAWYRGFLNAHNTFYKVLAEGDRPIEDCGQTPLDEP